MPILDWQSLPNGREKYQAYLASREWAVLKEAVRKRSAGTCERCLIYSGTQTHHQTYERQYRENLEDLLHVCHGCHSFLSGKSHDDPVIDVGICEGDGYIGLVGKRIEIGESSRIGRLAGILEAICERGNGFILKNVRSVHDHKGCMTVVWKSTPTSDEMKVFDDIWMDDELGDGGDEAHHIARNPEDPDKMR